MSISHLIVQSPGMEDGWPQVFGTYFTYNDCLHALSIFYRFIEATHFVITSAYCT